MFAPRPRPVRLPFAVLLAVLAWLLPTPARAYSVQTHEQLIDLTWKPSIVPLLQQRFPGITPAQLQRAHAYAYGGCAIQDLGYYPFGHEIFSDLTHYVRSGDFVAALLRDARDANELAFAIGALSHYIGDTLGHAEAVNPSVALEFPRLAGKYGPSVNYAEGERQHVRTEFAFDINEISKHRFAPSAYLKHVGLEIPDTLLRRAFFETYGLDLHEVLGHHRPVLRGYRFSVRSFLPRIAYAETVLHRNRFPPDAPSQDLDLFERQLAQSDFENGWDAFRKRPGIGTYSLAGLIFILPKVGVLSSLAIRGPQPATELLYVQSLNRTTASLRSRLETLDTLAAAIPNRDLDTGDRVRPGGYPLTDQTYANLLHQITHPDGNAAPLPLPVGLRDDILFYYADPSSPISTRRNPKRWAEVQADLKLLQAASSQPITPGPPQS